MEKVFGLLVTSFNHFRFTPLKLLNNYKTSHSTLILGLLLFSHGCTEIDIVITIVYCK